MRKIEDIFVTIFAVLVFIPMSIFFWVLKKSGMFIIVDRQEMERELDEKEKDLKSKPDSSSDK